MKVLLFSLVMVVMCCGCSKVSERVCYRKACDAVRGSGELPAGAVLGPIGDAKMYILKDAARVDLSYRADSPGGGNVVGTYTVWLKRLGDRWHVDRSGKAPTYE